MLENIIRDIEENQDEIVSGLLEMIELTSADGKPTIAQSVVEKELKQQGFEVDCFKGELEKLTDCPDYCKPDIIYDEHAYNVVGKRKGSDLNKPSLMLFGHIDTEAEDYFGRFDNPYKAYEKNGKIYGLGSSDDKGGIAMMLYASKYVLKHVGALPYDLTIMSILGKHGGAYGTLTALNKGYTAENSIYLHPAETGHGFAEIKNISLGVVDLDIEAFGAPGKMHDDLDPGVNANILAGKIISLLEQLNQTNREKYVFDFGSFQGEPSYILNVGSIHSDYGYGGIAQKTTIKVRVRFYYPLTIESVFNEIEELLSANIEDKNSYRISQGVFRASPAIVKTENPFVQFIEKNISSQCGTIEFIHQYHGGSDIRLPIIYGKSNCVGIGPACKLPEKGSNEMEYINKEDFITGVKILASILYNYINY